LTYKPNKRGEKDEIKEHPPCIIIWSNRSYNI